jgi:hypothetical protein
MVLLLSGPDAGFQGRCKPIWAASSVSDHSPINRCLTVGEAIEPREYRNSA